MRMCVSGALFRTRTAYQHIQMANRLRDSDIIHIQCAPHYIMCYYHVSFSNSICVHSVWFALCEYEKAKYMLSNKRRRRRFRRFGLGSRLISLRKNSRLRKTSRIAPNIIVHLS